VYLERVLKGHHLLLCLNNQTNPTLVQSRRSERRSDRRSERS